MTPLRPTMAARSFSLVGLIVLLLVATPASAATVTSAASGPWTSPSTWGGGVVPGPADDAVVAAGHTVTVAVADSPTVNSLSINAGQTTTANATLQVAGTLAVTTSITLTGGSQQATAPSGTATLSVGGTVTAAELNVFGGAGTTVGPGGAAAVNLTATSAIVTISGNVALAPGSNSTYPGGAPSIAFSAAGTLDVRGDVSNQGTITLGAGLFKHGGDYSGTGTLNASSGTLRLDGTDFQMWQGSSFTFQNLTITNSSANPSFASGAAEIWADVTVNGTLALQGGVLSVVGSVTVASPSVIQRTSGHVSGQINMPMPASQAVAFPLGTAVHYMPLTITSPTAGTLFARSREYAQPESGQASLQGHWELWSSDIPTLQQIVFGYEAAQVMGSEASYVAGRTESYGVPWERYPTTVNTAAHTATITGTITPNGSWTLAEPWAVTTATNFSARIASGAGNPRINTPFAVVLDAKDGSGNPAVFSSSMSVSIAPGASPTPTGTLKDEWGSLPPLYLYTPEWETSATLDGLLYDVAESITIVLTDTGGTPRFSPITLNVTFDPPAAALVVSTTAPEGDGSLAHAIATANNGGCSSTPCPISFNLPPAQQSADGTWKIVMPAMIAESQDADSYLSSSSTIPYANAAVIIDATTQPGYAGTPVVELDGGGAWSGIELYGGASTIRGLAIHNVDTGLYLAGSGGHVVEGCYIGLSATGAVTAPGTMYEGIWIDSPGNFIGGPTAQQRNVIADAWSTGIYVSSYMAGNSIRGNYVGTNPAGSAAIGNGTGIYVESYGNIIGGILAGEGNLVAGNADYGLLLVQPMYAASGPIASNVDIAVAATPNQVQGNTFGRSTGGSDLLNGSGAIGVTGGGQDYVLVGGPAAGQGNVIAHGSAHGVAMGQGVSGVVVSGNTYAGAGLPIDINGDYAPLANDPGDADVNMIECPVSGPCVLANQGQNTPEIITATQVGTTLEAVVKVDSSAVTATQSIRVELYAGDAVSKTLISSACFNTNFVNNLTVFAANSPTTAGSQVLATATSYTIAGCQPTDGLGNTTIGDGTSEFSAPATVTACNAPVVTITPPSPKLCAGGSVVLTASVSGGSGTYSSYQWFNGATPISGANSLTYTATAAGTYSFTATDNTGCPGSATVTVTQNPALSVAIAASGPTTFCAGGSVTLSANATGGSGTVSTYAWYNGTAPISGATGPTLAVTSGGTYKVVITDSAGCSAEATQPVTVNAKPTASVSAGGPTTFCSGGSVTLTAAGSGGAGGGYTYQWLNGGSPISGANASTLNVTASGSYSVVVSDANCQSAPSSPVSVTVNPALVVNITPSGPTTFCAGGSVTLSANATGGSGTVSTYAWYNGTAPISGATGPTLAVTSGGTYKVVVTDSAGCSAEATQPVTVNAKPTASVSAGGPTTFCSGGSVTLTAAGSGGAGGGYTYQWLNGGSPISGANASTLNVTASGSYSVVVSDANCQSAPSSPVSVTVNPTPVVNITPSGPTTFCEGGSVTLTATAGSSYQWFKDGTLISTATSQTLLVTASGGYSVTVTNGAGCSGTSGTVSVSVTAAPQPVISGPASTCSGSSVTLNAGAGYTTYLWSNGATTQTITVAPTATTSYTVTVTNANGCSKTSAPHTVTVAAAPSVTITGPASVCAGTPFTLDAGAGFDTYLWSNGATSRTITVSQTAATTYSVQVTLGGCSAAASKLVSVTPAPDATISTAASVDPQTSRNSASAIAQSGASYSWSITNGTITSGHGTNAVLFDAGASGDITLTLTVTIGDCSATRTVTVAINNLVSDLSVRMTAPAEVRSASSFAYTIEIRNDGPSPASNAVLTASLPAGVTVGSATGVWPCSTSGLSVTCQSASVPVGPVGTITLNVTAPGSAGTLAASALITSGTTDNNGANNTSGATTEVVGAQASCPTVAPSLVSPANNATGVTSPVTFTWTAVEGATSYEVWITTGAPQLLGTTGTTSLTGPVPSGALTWYVVARAGDACGSVTSASRQLTVAPANNCPTAAPQLTAPAAGSTTSSPVTFTWSSVANATGYRVLIRVNGEAILQDLGTTTSALTLSAPVPAGSIEAFVEAIYAGCPAVRSTGVTFTVAAPDPCADRQIATLNSPANDAVVNSSLVTFVWTAAEGADGYRLWVSVDEGTPQVLGSTEGQTSVQVALGRGTMTWWIEALYDGCASTESARRKFTIPPATDCGTALADPILPLNGAVVPNSDVTFTWANVPSAVEYELWLSLGEGTPTLFGETDGATTSLTSRWMPTGNMKWFVRARVDRCPARDSASASFTSQTPPSCETNQRPILVFPADGERLTSPTNLRWSTPQGATRFEILVDRGHGPVVAATSTGSSAENVILPTGRVKWFARAYFGEGCSALDSAEQSIEVLPPPAVCQDLLPPIVSAPGQISSGVSFRIHWTPIPGATSYNLLIASRPDFGDAQVVTVSSPEYQLTRENRTASNTAVYVRARAIDSRCNPASFGPYGPTSAIFILPFGSAETGSLASESTIVKSSITLGAELAGQTFVASAAESWITITPSSGMVPAGGITLEVTADTRGLPLGTTIGGVTVTLTSPGSAGSVASHGTTTVTTPITVNLVTPVTPTAKSGPPPDALIIPAVAHADGVNAKFQSDVRVTNTSPQLMKYLITFTPSGDGIGSGRQTTLSIEPGRTIALDDVLKSWFGTGSVSTTGTLEIRPQTQAFAATSSATVKGLANLATFASSRTFNLAANGSFGQHIPAIPFANFIGKAASAQASVLSLQQIAQSSQYRTNLGLVEASGNPASLLVSVFGKSGDKLTSFTVDLKGGQHTQLNSFLAQRGITSLDDGRVEVAVTSGLGKVTAYASVLDNKTSDPLLVTPVSLSEAGDTKWVVPGVADLNNGFANWQTDLRIFNGESEPVETTVSFYSQNGGAPKTATLTIPAGQVRQLDRALSTLFSTANDGGAIHLATSKASRIVATARTYNLTGTGGTYGQFISAVTQGETAGVGTRPLQLLQVEESERFRSNIGLAETSGKPVKVSLSVIPPDAKLTAFVEVDLAPNEFRQISSLLKTVGLTNTHNARVTVRAIEGAGRVTAYASVVDLLTQDPTYIPAQ